MVGKPLLGLGGTAPRTHHWRINTGGSNRKLIAIEEEPLLGVVGRSSAISQTVAARPGTPRAPYSPSGIWTRCEIGRYPSLYAQIPYFCILSGDVALYGPPSLYIFDIPRVTPSYISEIDIRRWRNWVKRWNPSAHAPGPHQPTDQLPFRGSNHLPCNPNAPGDQRRPRFFAPRWRFRVFPGLPGLVAGRQGPKRHRKKKAKKIENRPWSQRLPMGPLPWTFR